jgi:hypothetical protein
MLEAVNSVLQTAPLVRANAEQVSSGNSYSANPNQVQKATQAPYVSPYYSVDTSDNQIVLEIRNPSTGAILQSYPTEAQIQDRKAQAQQDAIVSSQSSHQGNDGEKVVTQTSQPAPAIGAGYAAGSPGQTRSPSPPATNRQIAAFAAASSVGQQGGGGSVSLVA